jgi:hypothetical protein
VRALRFHPDKCTAGPEEREEHEKRFKEVVEAYNCLWDATSSDTDETPMACSTDVGYMHTLSMCLQSFSVQISHEQVERVCSMIESKCHDISLKIFSELTFETALNLYGFLAEYKTYIGVSNTMLNRIEAVVQEKIKDGSVVILHPTLHHLLDKQVYVLKGEGQKPSTVCIPLWNQEATCEIDGQLTFIRCVPSLPAHMWLDDGNNLHVAASSSASDLLKKGSIELQVEDTTHEISASKLHVVEKQNYVFAGLGIPVNGAEPTEPVPMSDLVVHVTLT